MTDLSSLTPLQRAGFALKRMRAELDRRHEPIAIVGMACRYPGGANDINAFWDLLDNGRDTLVDIPRERWDAEPLYREQLEPGKFWQTYMRRGYFIDQQLDKFDADFFRVSPREASGMDPQQRVMLEVAWEALEDATIPAEELRESKTGVYIGLITGDYGRIPFEEINVDSLAYYGTGNAISFPAGRIAYFLGLQGPCMVVASACSSTLVSTHLAINALRNGECDLALSGGASLMILPDTSLTLARMGAISREGRSRAFDAGADGFGRGEGCGLMVLKRLSDAQRDGDRIYALLRGSAVNHDGPSGGLTVPHGPAQEKLLVEALASAKLQPEAVDYVEAHGTGTLLGDPIEARALNTVFGTEERKSPLLIGSVKTNIGHLEAAAGVAGLTKLALALCHESLPASLHFETPNPAIDWANTKVQVNSENRAWPRGERERVAGVSAFGLSGINAHVLVSEAPLTETETETQLRDVEVLPLSAKTPEALDELIERWAGLMTELSDAEVSHACHSARVGRSHLDVRAAVTGRNREELGAALRERPRSRRIARDARQAWLLTGQGSQAIDMGRGLFESEPSFRAAVEACAKGFDAKLEQPLLEVLYPDPRAPELAMSLIDETRWAHVTLFTLEYALGRMLLDWGARPDYMLGHSLGEIVAACLAGVFELDAALHVVEARGRLMQSISDAGTMVSVTMTPEEVGPFIAPFSDRVSIASHNAPRSVVLSGDVAILEGLVTQLESQGARCRKLRVSHAFHSPLMEPILDEFESEVASVERHLPNLTIVSSCLARPIEQELLDPRYWRKHLRDTSRLAESFAWLGNNGAECFVELGPHPVLCNLGRQNLDDANRTFVSVLGRDTDEQCLARACAGLHASGFGLDWRAFDRDRGYRRRSIPFYPWQHRSHWLEMPRDYLIRRMRDHQSSTHGLLGQRLDIAAGPAVFDVRVGHGAPPWLSEHRVFGMAVLPGAAWVELFLAVGAEVIGSPSMALEDIEFLLPLALPEDQTGTAQIIAEMDPSGWSLRAYSRPDASEPWVLHARARVLRAPANVSIEGLEQGAEPQDAERAGRFYEIANKLGLEYGPAFRPIRALEGEGVRCRGLLTLPAELDANGWNWHPILGDGCLQVLGAVFPDEVGEAVHLPVAIRRVVLHHRVGDRAQVEATIEELENESGGEAHRRASFAVYSSRNELCVTVEGVEFRAASLAALRAELRPGNSDWWYAERWLEEPRPASTAQENTSTDANSGRGPWWIVADESTAQTAQYLGTALRTLGENVEILTDIVDLKPRLSNDPHCAGLVDLRLLATKFSPEAYAGVEFASAGNAAKDACLMMLESIRIMFAQAAQPRIACVSANGIALAGSSPNPIAAAVHGLLRVAAREHAEVRVLSVDISAEQNELDELARELIGWASGAISEERVALRKGVRHIPRLDRLAVGRNNETSDSPYFTPEGVCLITGGTRGIGAQILEPLVDAGARNLVLVSRGGKLGDDGAAAIVEGLRERGVKIVVRGCDVSDLQAVEELVAWIESEVGPLRGVVHSAGVLEDAALLDLDATGFAHVFGPKVLGAENLDRATRGCTLDAFVLFSSAAVSLASVGQGNYVAANAFVEALAERRRAQGLPAIALGWGAWDEVGMAARSGVAGRLEAAGMHSISLESGRECLAVALREMPVRASVMPVDWRRVPAHGDPFFAELVGPRTSVEQSSGELVARLRECPANQRGAELRAFVTMAAAKVLGREVEELGPELHFFDLGMDSMMSVELRDRLQRELSASLPATVAVENSTIASLADWLESNVPALVELASNSLHDSASDVELEDSVDHATELDLLDSVAELSDVDIRSQLRSRRRMG